MATTKKNAPAKPVSITPFRAAHATESQALEMGKEAGRQYRAADKDMRERVIPLQALAVHAAYASGLLGGTRKPGEKAAMTQEEYASILGISQARVSNLKTLGHLLAVVGVESSGDEWKRTVAVAGNIGKDTAKLGDDSAKSKDAVKRTVGKFYNPDGTRKTVKRSGSNGNGSDTDALFAAAFAASNAGDAFDRVVAFVVGRIGTERVTKETRERIESGIVALTDALEVSAEEVAS